MTKIIFRQCLSNWKITFGSFFVLLLASLFIGSFSLLFINIFTLKTADGTSMVSSVPFFAIIFVIIIFISVMSLYSSIKLSVELKWNQYVNLRIIGFSFSKIKKMVFADNLVVTCITIVIGALLSAPIYHQLLTFFMNNGVLPENLVLTNANLPIYDYAYIPIVILLVFFVLYLSILPIKEFYRYRNSDLVNTSLKSAIISWIFGFLFLGVWLLLNFIKPQQDIATVLFSQIFYVMGFSLLSKYALYGWLAIFNPAFKWMHWPNFAIKEAKRYVRQLAQIVFIVMMIIVFINLSLNALNMVAAKINSQVGIDALRALAYVLTITLVCYAFVIAVNAIILYVIKSAKRYECLRLIGYKRSLILAHAMFQMTLVVFFAIICGLLPSLLIDGLFCVHNNMNIIQQINWVGFLGSIIGGLILPVIVSALTIFALMIFKNLR